MGEERPLSKKIIRWTDKIIVPRKIADTPALNKDGYWKKKKPENFEVNE